MCFMLKKFSNDFDIKALDWNCKPYYNSNYSKYNKYTSLFRKSLVI